MRFINYQYCLENKTKLRNYTVYRFLTNMLKVHQKIMFYYIILAVLNS